MIVLISRPRSFTSARGTPTSICDLNRDANRPVRPLPISIRKTKYWQWECAQNVPEMALIGILWILKFFSQRPAVTLVPETGSLTFAQNRCQEW
jgi:hypothetical protein